MARPTENTGFTCLNGTKIIKKLTNGSYRNHCPYCLYSLHLDNQPGDRANRCQGLLEPIALVYKPKKGWQIVHRCQKCAHKSVNKVAIDTIQPDDWERLAMVGREPF